MNASNTYTTAALRANLAKALEAPRTGEAVTDISSHGSICATITPPREGQTVKKMMDIKTPGNEILLGAFHRLCLELEGNPEPMDVREAIDRLLDKVEVLQNARREGLDVTSGSVRGENGVASTAPKVKSGERRAP